MRVVWVEGEVVDLGWLGEYSVCAEGCHLLGVERVIIVGGEEPVLVGVVSYGEDVVFMVG